MILFSHAFFSYKCDLEYMYSKTVSEKNYPCCHFITAIGRYKKRVSFKYLSDVKYK